MMRWMTFVLMLSLGPTFGRLRADEPKPLAAEQIDQLHKLIKRQPTESRWMEIAWYPTIWESRQKAAREGKPLFIWAGSGGAPAAGC